VARSLGIEAGYLAGFGANQRALAMAAECERISAEIGDAQATPYVFWARGAVSLFARSEWRKSLATFDEGIAALRRNRQIGGWETVTAEVYRAVALLRLGELAALARQIRLHVAQAERRGDRYAAVNLQARFNIVWLMQDDPTEAERELEDALASWPAPTAGFQMQHAWGFRSRCELALYLGESARAWRWVEETWPMLSGSLLFRIPSIRVDCWEVRGRAALAHAAELAALTGGDSADLARFLDQAARCARQLAGEKPPLARVLARLIEASIADIRGQREQAIGALRAGLSACEEIELQVYAQAARYRLGQVVGGMDGAAIMAEAELWMREQEVANPHAFAVLHLPGLFRPPREAGR
jgi:hypothetical protein